MYMEEINGKFYCKPQAQCQCSNDLPKGKGKDKGNKGGKGKRSDSKLGPPPGLDPPYAFKAKGNTPSDSGPSTRKRVRASSIRSIGSETSVASEKEKDQSEWPYPWETHCPHPSSSNTCSLFNSYSKLVKIRF
jgi:hypothetical protein